jgi:hypothetical protein
MIESKNKFRPAVLGIVGAVAAGFAGFMASKPNISMTCVMHIGTCEKPNTVIGTSTSLPPTEVKSPKPGSNATAASPIDPTLKVTETLRFENYQSNQKHN